MSENSFPPKPFIIPYSSKTWRKLIKTRQNSFAYKNILKLCISYEFYSWSRDLNDDFRLSDCLFGALTLTKNVDFDKYSGYSIRFDSCSLFLI